MTAFTAKLAKELKRNTKKTAILAIVCILAVWLWAPLIWGWMGFGNEQTTVDVMPPNTTTPTVATPAVSHSASAASVPDLSWKKLTDLFSHHQLMKTAELQLEAAAPFGKKETKPVATEKETERSTDEDAATDDTQLANRPTPKELGLKLTSTVTGRGIELAVINGNTCHLGAELIVPYQDRDVQFKLVQVRPDVVSLFDGQELHLLTREVSESQIQLGSAMTMHAPNRESPDRIRIESGYRD